MMEIILSDAYFATKPKPKHSSQPKCDGKHTKMRNAKYRYKSKQNTKGKIHNICLSGAPLER